MAVHQKEAESLNSAELAPAPFTLRPLSRSLGVEVLGIDLSAGVDPDTFEKLRGVLNEKGALLFRNQNINDEQYIGFARQLGELETHALQKSHIVILSNGVKDGKPIGLFDAGQFWHSDGSYTSKPSMYTLLYSIEVPRDDNGEPLGDTLLASTLAAYDELPADLKAKLANAQGVFSYKYRYLIRKAANPNATADPSQTERPDVRHPVFRPHPLTGRKGIFVNEGYVKTLEGVPPGESEGLLKRVLAHVTSERYVYRHRWQEGDVLVWDNNSAQHSAIPNYSLPQLRLIKRIGVKSPAN